MKIHIHLYEAWGGRGAVVGFEEGGLIGWSDLRPWPNFGTLSLEAYLQDLRQDGLLPLVQHARYFASLDRDAKRNGRSLFEGLALPKSHVYVTDWNHCRSPNESYKIKALPGELETHLARLPPGVRVRLDWNGGPSFKEAHQTLQALGSLRERIEWIEDPCPFIPEDWQELSRLVQLVKDREPGDAGDWAVCYKPCMDGWPVSDMALFRGKKVLVSQVLGSPLDALQTAWVAGQLQKQGVQVAGGFLTEQATVLPLSKGLGWGWEPPTWTSIRV